MKKIFFWTVLLVFITISITNASNDPNPLAPVRTDDPRATMHSYLTAMSDYKKGLVWKDERLIARLDDAVRCFNLEDIPVMSRTQVGRDAAVFLKEVLDRVILIDYEKIPEKSDDPKKPLTTWRLKGTEIIISLVTKGDRAGEYLFSPSTTMRAEEFYEKVKHLKYLMGSERGAGYKEPWLKRVMPGWAEERLLDLAYWQWLGLLLAILMGLITRTVLIWIVRKSLRFAKKTENKWDDRIVEAVALPIGLLAATGVWFASLHLLRFKGLPLSILSTVIQILLFGGLTWLFYRLSGVLGEYLLQRAAKTEDKLDDQLVKLITQSMNILLVIFGVLLAAQNLGIDVFSLIAGLGIGGLAVALAAKDSLANFFGSIMIMLDRPFQIGHWIRAGGTEGTVEDIGFRSTKIRTFYDSLISVPNSEIAMANIDNMGLRKYRRIFTTLGITYDTPPDKIEAFLEGIKNVIQANPFTRKDYFHVAFSGFGASGLEIMLYFFLTTDNWSDELIERQNVFLEIIRLADTLGVRFAFPTQSIHVETFPEKASLTPEHAVGREEMARMAKNFGKKGQFSRPAGSGLFLPPHREKG